MREHVCLTHILACARLATHTLAYASTRRHTSGAPPIPGSELNPKPKPIPSVLLLFGGDRYCDVFPIILAPFKYKETSCNVLFVCVLFFLYYITTSARNESGTCGFAICRVKKVCVCMCVCEIERKREREKERERERERETRTHARAHTHHTHTHTRTHTLTTQASKL